MRRVDNLIMCRLFIYIYVFNLYIYIYIVIHIQYIYIYGQYIKIIPVEN